MDPCVHDRRRQILGYRLKLFFSAMKKHFFAIRLHLLILKTAFVPCFRTNIFVNCIMNMWVGYVLQISRLAHKTCDKTAEGILCFPPKKTRAATDFVQNFESHA